MLFLLLSISNIVVFECCDLFENRPNNLIVVRSLIRSKYVDQFSLVKVDLNQAFKSQNVKLADLVSTNCINFK